MLDTRLYPAEIVPLRIRAPANGFSTSSNWIWNFMGRPTLQSDSLRYLMLIDASGHDHSRCVCLDRIPDLHHLRRHV